MFQSRIQPAVNTAPPTAIEGFAGAGGLSCGLRDAGFDIRLAFDFDPTAVETYARNLGHQVHKIDARAITGAELLDLACVRVRELDVYAGGSPCQGWSKQRRRGPEDGWDERNDLIFHHARIGAEMLPKFVVFENVPAVLEPRNRVHVDRIQAILHRYRMHASTVCASDFGTPQRRRRAVLLFVRDDLDGIPELLKSPRQLSVRDAFDGLPEPPDDGSDHPEFVHHSRSQLGDLNVRRLQSIPEGGGWTDLPHELRLDCHQRYAESGRSGGWRDVFGRMAWDLPAPTLTTGCLTISKGRFAHPSSDRAITPREAARLQGFPDDFVFHGTRETIARQIGNAVPVPLARAIGDAIKRVLDKDRLENVPAQAHSPRTKIGDVSMDRLSEIEKQLQDLARERDQIIKAQRAEALSEARRLVSTYSITARELGISEVEESEPETGKRRARAAAKIKYRHGEDTWSGRGKQPKWIREFVASGRDLEEIRA